MSTSSLLSYRAARRGAPDDVGLLLGPMVIGVVLNVWLLGFVMAQCYAYFLSQGTRKDPIHRWIKVIVGFLLFVDVVNSVFNIAMLYDYTVIKFGDYQGVGTATWLFVTDPTLTVVVSFVVQTFFSWRMRKITGQTWLGVLVALGAFAQLLCGIGTTIAATIITDFTEAQRFKSIIIVWLVLAPLTDATIAWSLVWHLRRHRTGYKSTDELISRIVRLTLQTGLITTIWVLLDLAFFLAYPNNLHMIFHIPTSKLYTNSLLSSLNARGYWSKSSGAFGDSDLNAISDIAFVDRSGTKSVHANGVRIATSTAIHRDDLEFQGSNYSNPVINIVHPESSPDIDVVHLESEYESSVITGDEHKTHSLDGINKDVRRSKSRSRSRSRES